jgi:hypothetical protein
MVSSIEDRDVASADVATLPLAPRNPLPLWRQLTAARAPHRPGNAARRRRTGDQSDPGTEAPDASGGYRHLTAGRAGRVGPPMRPPNAAKRRWPPNCAG